MSSWPGHDKITTMLMKTLLLRGESVSMPEDLIPRRRATKFNLTVSS